MRRRGDRNIERHRVHDSRSLKLHPHTVDAGARKRHAEPQLLLRVAVGVRGGDGMAVNHVDQVRTGGQHVAPGTQIRLESFGRCEREDEGGPFPGDRARRHRQLDMRIKGLLGRHVRLNADAVQGQVRARNDDRVRDELRRAA